jgi:hypothetical protein
MQSPADTAEGHRQIQQQAAVVRWQGAMGLARQGHRQV